MRPVLHSGMNEIKHCQETGESWATGQAKNSLPPRCGAASQSCRPYWQPLLLSNTYFLEGVLSPQLGFVPALQPAKLLASEEAS